MPDIFGPDSDKLNAPQDRVYLEWGASVTLGWDFGLAGMPSAGPAGSPVKFVRLHGGYNRKWVTWATTCLGDNPVVPDPFAVPDNEVPLGALLSLPIPGALPDGTPVVSICGQYAYGLQVPIALGRDPIPFGNNPLIQAGTRTLNPADFVRYLIGAVQNPTGGLGGYQATRVDY